MRDELTQRLVEHFELDHPGHFRDLFSKMNGTTDAEAAFVLALREMKMKATYEMTAQIEKVTGCAGLPPAADHQDQPAIGAKYHLGILLNVLLRQELQKIPR